MSKGYTDNFIPELWKNVHLNKKGNIVKDFDWKKEIMSLSVMNESTSKNKVMAFPWNCGKDHDSGYHKEGYICHCDDGYLCKHRAKWLIKFLEKYV